MTHTGERLGEKELIALLTQPTEQERALHASSALVERGFVHATRSLIASEDPTRLAREAQRARDVAERLDRAHMDPLARLLDDY